MPVPKCAGLIVLAFVLAACTGLEPTPTPTVTPAPTAVPPTAIMSPTWTPVGRVTLTALRELTMHAGPSTAYQQLGLLPAGAEAVAFGRDRHGTWVRLSYEGMIGWVPVGEDGATISGDLADLPIVPVPRITNTPPPPPETHTPFPTPTPRPTRTPAHTNTPAPTPDDYDRRAFPVHSFGVLPATFSESGSGSLSLPNDEFDYIGFQFDQSVAGQISIVVEFTCDNPDAELVLTLFSAQRRDEEMQHLYPVCNRGPMTIYALESGNYYQLRIWLRDAEETGYTFRIHKP
jgi:hypothetical protein